MITATFIFKPVSQDAEFQRLNDEIDEIARKSEGYLGAKKWRDSAGNKAVVYYWRSLKDLDTFRRNPTHKLAKSRYADWYAGYRLEIAEVQSVYGDGYYDRQFPSEGESGEDWQSD